MMLVRRLLAFGSITTVEARWAQSAFLFQRRKVHLPPRQNLSSADDESAERMSVTGQIYDMPNGPTVKLFTKQGCTLCDKVKDVLESVRKEHPHSLHAVDITDDDKQHWFSKYKYDIPVLHMDDIYWAKHRLSVEEAVEGIQRAQSGAFQKSQGEPDASRLEHNS